MNEWKPISEAPRRKYADMDKPRDFALVYSPEFGIKVGEINVWPDGPRGHVGGYHGCAVRDWGVTHWMPLPPAPPVDEKATQG